MAELSEHPTPAPADVYRSRTGMVVGVDGSTGAAQALAWAAARTEQFGLIRPVAAWQYPWWTLSGPVPVSSVPSYDELARLATEHAEDAVASVPEELRAPMVVCQSAAGPTLVEQGADAALIVVGTRGRGAVADTLLGSVSCHVVANASVPVAIVPLGAEVDPSRGRVVVGIDGSANSVQALIWALSTAEDGQVVEVLHTWSYVATAFPEAPAIPLGDFEASAGEVMERTVAAAEAAVGDHGSEIVRTIVEGDPRQQMRAASERADHLVLGARGHQGFAHTILGSVTSGLVHQPVITTVVVPRAS